MGSKQCKDKLRNRDILTVITLTDSLVQRLPLGTEGASPLEREAREQNIDDFWKERIECLQNAFDETVGISEKCFLSMEKRILSMAPPLYKQKCPMNVDDIQTCYLLNPKDPLKCERLVKKFLLCIDTLAEDESRRGCLNAERAKRKKKC